MIRIPRADLISKISFAIFIFVALFGTSPPFQPKMQERDELITGNIINQLLYPVLFLLSFIAFLSKTKQVMAIIKREKYLSILLLYALLTFFWSNAPIDTLKRWFQFFTFFFIILVFISHIDSLEELLKFIRPILYSYVLISILSVVIIPGARDPVFGSWRGLAMHKNHLGQISIVCSVLGLIIFVYESKNIRKLVAFGIFFFSVLLGIGTLSSTTYTALFVFLNITLLYYVKKQIFSKIGASNILFFTTIFTGLSLLAVFLIFAPETLDKFQAMFGKEGSFDDRGRLWQYIVWSIAEHPYFGCGFQGFWVQGTPAVELLYTSFLWLPIQGHNGYLDILNEMGIVGMFLFLLVLLNYFRFAFFKKKINLWNWFIVLPLVVNITETTFFRAGHTSNVFFLMSYLIMFSSLNENRQDYLNEK